MGWARQVEKGVERPTIQGAILKAIYGLNAAGGTVDVQVAGRTDAGVHAVAQVAHVDGLIFREKIKYIDGFNRYLPHEIRVLDASWVGEDFHARYSAKSRTYRYIIYEGRSVRPDLRGRVGHVMQPLDMEKMKLALDLVGVGQHDFTSLRDAECQSDSPILQMIQWDVRREVEALGESFVVVEVTCNRFLHHMIRNLLGILVPIGLEKKPPEWLKEVLEAKDRKKAGVTFMPDGLYLFRVDYGV